MDFWDTTAVCMGILGETEYIHTWKQVRYCFFYAILIRSSFRPPVFVSFRYK